MLLALDTETTGLTYNDSAFLMSFAEEGAWHSGVYDLTLHSEAAKIWVHSVSSTYIFHNAKFDLRMLIKAGVLCREDITVDSFHDTQILAQLIDENRSLKLKDLAKSVLGQETDEAEVVRMWRRKLKLKKTDGYDKLPREIVIPYARKDAEFTLDLYHALMILFPESCMPLYDRERQVVLDVLDMEENGLGVDLEYSEWKRRDLNGRLLRTLNELTQIARIEDFNPGSTKQLAEVLISRGNILPTTEKGNPKTDSATLSKLGDTFALQILEYRKMSKLLNTYIIPALDEGKSGILHPNFNLSGAKTGRFSSSKARE